MDGWRGDAGDHCKILSDAMIYIQECGMMMFQGSDRESRDYLRGRGAKLLLKGGAEIKAAKKK